jgi:hypothetical protein
MDNSPTATPQGFLRVIDTLDRRYQQACASKQAAPRVVVILGAAASFGSKLPSWGDPNLKKDIYKVAEDCFQDRNVFSEMGLDNWHPSYQKFRPNVMICALLCSNMHRWICSAVLPVKFQIFGIASLEF